jgi:hypothetical protein
MSSLLHLIGIDDTPLPVFFTDKFLFDEESCFSGKISRIEKLFQTQHSLNMIVPPALQAFLSVQIPWLK